MMSSRPSSFRKVAQSYQQPRTLESYKAHFGKSKGNREGYLNVKRVPKNFGNPNDFEWEERYVVLRDGMVYYAPNEEMELTELVSLSAISSVKIQTSLQSSSVIVLSCPRFCYYLHSLKSDEDAREEDMKDWLFSFHTSVLVYLLRIDDEDQPLNIPVPVNRHVLFGRSKSGDAEEDSRLWSKSEDIESFKELVGGDQQQQQQDSASGSPSSASTSSGRSGRLKVRTVDDIDASELEQEDEGKRINNKPKSGPASFPDSPSGSMFTRETVGAATKDAGSILASAEKQKGQGILGRMASPPPLPPSSNGNGGGHNVPRPKSRPSPLESDNAGNFPMPTPSRSPVFDQYHGQRRASAFPDLFSTSESTKRVTAPPVEVKTTTSSSKPKPGKYVPPHLRNQQQQQQPQKQDASPREKNGGYRRSDSLSSSSPDSHHFPSSSGRSLAAMMEFHESHGLPNTHDGGDDDELFEMDAHQGGSGDLLGDEDDDGRMVRTPHRDRGDSDCLLYGRTAEQGCRPTMEDFDVTEPQLFGRPLGFYAVYDGHCGFRVAEMASQKLHVYSNEIGDLWDNWPHGAMDAVNQALERVEQEFFEIATSSNYSDGSCALIALVHYPDFGSKPDSVAVANLGDSRAVIYHAGKFEALSEEHSPARPDERERIEAAGGWVTIEKEMLIEKLHRMDLSDPMVRKKASRKFNYVETSRVNGELAVSRALGDIDYKKPKQDNYAWFFPKDHPAFSQSQYEFGANLVHSVPDWRIFDLNQSVQLHEQEEEEEEGGGDEQEQGNGIKGDEAFLIIACDGIWDALSNEDAVEICKGKTPQAASAALVDAALKMGTSDNVTALVISLADVLLN